METSSFSSDIQRYFGILRRWLWLVILVTILAGGLAYIISKRSQPVYESVTTVLISEAPASQSNDYTAIMTSERLAKTYSQLMTKLPVLEGVIARLGLATSPADLKQAIQVQPVRDTTLIEVRVEDANPQQAADIANGLVAEFSERNQSLQALRYQSSKENLQAQLAESERQIKQASDQLAVMSDAPDEAALRDRLEANLVQERQTYASLLQSYEEIRLAEAQSTSNLIQAEPAVPAEMPVRPRALYNMIFAMVLGLAVVVGLIFFVEALDDTLKSPDDVIRVLNLQVLGVISRHSAEEAGPAALLEPRSMVAEAFRSLRTNLQFASLDHQTRSLLITSPTPAEGKSTVATNLAVVIAQGGRKVALVDADLRRPRIHELMGVPNTSGLSDIFLTQEPGLNGALQASSSDGLFVLTSGRVPPNPSELLGSARMAEILAQTLELVDIAIIDSPPVTVVTDSAVLAPRVDGVLLVLKPGVTHMSAATQTVEQLRRLGANILGVVLNEVDLKRLRYGYNHYKYYNTSDRFLDRNGTVSRRLKKWWKKLVSK